MLYKRIKIAVAVQQSQSAFDASRGNNRVDGLSHRYTQRPQRTEIPGRLNR